MSVSEASSIYDARYAERYPSLYLHPWTEKHQRNVDELSRIFDGLRCRTPRWLDVACGQAWHFTRLPDRIHKTGVDISAAQLRHARRANPGATLVRADMRRQVFAPRSFDLVSTFWASYCYLDSVEAIEHWMFDAIDCVRPGGAIYIEVLLPERVESFNRSAFARGAGFYVSPRTPDFTKWSYRDVGGLHAMTSPPLRFFVEVLSSFFASIEAEPDSGFMAHVVAREKHADSMGSRRERGRGR